MALAQNRILNCCIKVLPNAFKNCLWMLKMILPISLIVRLFQYWGVMDYIGMMMNGLFPLLGLPSDSSIVFLTSCFLPIYAPIALMTSMELTMRQATILSLMCLASHNLFVECTIAKKTGSSFGDILLLRLFASFSLAILANWLLPEDSTMFSVQRACSEQVSYSGMLNNWLISSLNLAKMLCMIVSLLMIIQALLEDYGLIKKMCTFIAPIMKIFGLSQETSFLWLVGNIVGLSYGGAIMIGMVEEGKISSYDADLVNRHLAVSHSLLEDTILFSTLGICAWWLLLLRIPLAIIAVWLKHLRDLLFHAKIHYSTLNLSS